MTASIFRALLATLALSLCVSNSFAANTTTPAEKDPQRHTGFLADIKKMNGKIGLVFVGDSITDGWRGGGGAIWKKNFAPFGALNLGVSGDQTQHVLWRLQNGELDGYQARLFVIMIGTNNGGDSAKDVADGITAIVTEIHKKQPQAKFLLLGIFPRSEKPDGARKKNDEVNKIVAGLDDGKTLKYMDIGDKFLEKDGTLPKTIMPDALHPNTKGYEIWCDAILPTVKGILGG